MQESKDFFIVKIVRGHYGIFSCMLKHINQIVTNSSNIRGFEVNATPFGKDACNEIFDEETIASIIGCDENKDVQDHYRITFIDGNKVYSFNYQAGNFIFSPFSLNPKESQNIPEFMCNDETWSDWINSQLCYVIDNIFLNGIREEEKESYSDGAFHGIENLLNNVYKGCFIFNGQENVTSTALQNFTDTGAFNQISTVFSTDSISVGNITDFVQEMLPNENDNYTSIPSWTWLLSLCPIIILAIYYFFPSVDDLHGGAEVSLSGGSGFYEQVQNSDEDIV